MALKPCRECTAMVSPKATSCPKCGAPKPVAAKNPTLALVLIGIIVFFVWPAPKNKAEPVSVPFDVSFEVGMDVNDQKPVVRVRTNLPENTTFMSDVANPINEGGTGYFAQYKAAVSPTGLVEFGPFTNQGEALRPGKYRMTIETIMAALQPENVRTVFGQNGENLTGNKISNLRISSVKGLGSVKGVSQTFVFKVHLDGTITV